MTVLTDARDRLAAGYYNSAPKTGDNPGGMAANGHQLNFPASLVDLGLVLLQAGVDAATLNATLPAINAVPGLKAAAEAARDAAIVARDQAVAIAGADLTLKANLASPAFTGNPTAPTQVQSDNSNRLATTSYVTGKFSALIGAAPSALDTIYELAAQMASDESAAGALTALVGTKLATTGGLMTGGLYFTPAGGRGAYAIVPDSGTNPGYSEYYTGDGIRRGYIGGASGSNMVLGSENGWNWMFSQRPTFAGAIPWDGSNLAPVDLGSAQSITGRKSFLGVSSPIGVSTANLGSLEVKSPVGGAAMIALHSPSNFACYLGLDTDAQLKIGGWSFGAVAHVIYHQGNDGSGSGLDADLFRGAAPDVSASASSIAKRGSSGQLTAAGFVTTGDTGLTLGAHGGGFYMNDDTWVRVTGNKNLVTTGTVEMGAFTVTSDRRLKTNITPLVETGEIIDAAQVYAFDKDGRRQWGVIAQEVAADPRTALLVQPGAATHEVEDDPILTVDVLGYVFALLGEVKALRQRLLALEGLRA